jgi:hypothetical protein
MNFTHAGHEYTIPDPTLAELEYLLMEIRFKRLRARMYDWLKHQASPPSTVEFQAKLDSLDAAFEFREESEDQAVEVEAREIAGGLIRARLAELGLPTPRESVFTQHVDQLLSANPSITERAKEQVEARANCATEILAEI